MRFAVLFDVVDDRLDAAAVRFEAPPELAFFAVRLRAVDPDAAFFAAGRLDAAFLAAGRLELVFLAVPLLVDFFAGELLEVVDFFAVDPLAAVFFAVEPLDADFLVVEPFDVDFFAAELLEVDFFAVADEDRRGFTLPSWISPPQPSTASWWIRAWFATCRR